MGLMDIFRSLIGERDGALSTQQGFQSQPDSNGLNFFMPTPAFQALQTGQGSALAKVQLIVFNMLTEQGIAETTANGFHIGAEDVSGMDLEQAEILRLPRRLPGRFLTSISGRTGNSGFRVAITLEMPDGAASFTRKGPYLFLTSSECYWLTPAEMMGLQAWERHEALLPEQRGEAANLRLMAELQTAARSGMRIDLSHFERLDVVVPENIGVIATRLPDGSLQLCPSLGDGSTADQLEKRWSQLDMTADGGVLRIDNRVLLVDQARMEGIRNVLANKRIPANQVNEFIATPTAFLDAALVNLEVGFSARVAGIGKLQHMDFGALDATKNDWFALDKRPAPAAILGKLIQSPEDLQRFEGVLQAANEQGATSVEFAGEVIDISDAPAVQQELAKARQNMHPVSDSESRDEEYEPRKARKRSGSFSRMLTR